MRRGLAVACSVLLTACGQDESLTQPAPAEPGPYAVGVTTLEAESHGRKLPLEIWYPAEAGGAVEEYRLMLGVLELGRADSPLGASRDAPPAQGIGRRPLVVFSHGNGGVRIQSVYLTEHLASHGFVVAAPDHVGNTLLEQVNQDLALPPAVAAAYRPDDVSAALDATLAASSGDGLLRELVDSERVGVAGHSFGAFTALRIAGATIDVAAVAEACAQVGGLVCDGWPDAQMPSSQHDPRFSVALAQAPAGSQAFVTGARNGLTDAAMPVMVQAGTTDTIATLHGEIRPIYDSLPAPKWLLQLDRAGHFSFSDMCRIVDILELTVAEFDDGCGPENMPWLEAQALSARYATAFLRSRLAGDAAYEVELWQTEEGARMTWAGGAGAQR